MWKRWWPRLGRMETESSTSTGAVLASTLTNPATPLLIDVRNPAEFAAVALRGAVNVPLAELAARIGALAPDRDAPLVLYCASGARSGMACQLLQRMGYKTVRNAGGVYAAAAALQVPLR